MCYLGTYIAMGAVLIWLAGCSPVIYENEIKSFKSYTDSAVKTVETYLVEKHEVQAINDLYRKLQSPEIEHLLIRLNDMCDHIPIVDGTCFAELCVIGEKDDNVKCEELKSSMFNRDSTAQERKGLERLEELAAYAAGLEKIASSETSAAINVALEELSGSVSSMAEPIIDSKVGPLTGLIAWMAGKYLEYKRWRTLKWLTESVHPALVAAKDELQQLSISFRDDYAAALLKREVHLSRDNSVKNEKNEDTVELIRKKYRRVGKLEKLLNSNPATMFDAMVKAHGELTAGVADSKRQAGIVFAALRDFRKSVDDVREAFEEEGAN